MTHYRKLYPEKTKETDRLYRLNNKEKIKIANKTYNIKDKERLSLEKSAKYYYDAERSRLNRMIYYYSHHEACKAYIRKSYRKRHSIGQVIKETEYKNPSYFLSRYRRTNGPMPGITE